MSASTTPFVPLRAWLSACDLPSSATDFRGQALTAVDLEGLKWADVERSELGSKLMWHGIPAGPADVISRKATAYWALYQKKDVNMASCDSNPEDHIDECSESSSTAATDDDRPEAEPGEEAPAENDRQPAAADEDATLTSPSYAFTEATPTPAPKSSAGPAALLGVNQYRAAVVAAVKACAGAHTGGRACKLQVVVKVLRSLGWQRPAANAAIEWAISTDLVTELTEGPRAFLVLNSATLESIGSAAGPESQKSPDASTTAPTEPTGDSCSGVIAASALRHAWSELQAAREQLAQKAPAAPLVDEFAAHLRSAAGMNAAAIQKQLPAACAAGALVVFNDAGLVRVAASAGFELRNPAGTDGESAAAAAAAADARAKLCVSILDRDYLRRNPPQKPPRKSELAAALQFYATVGKNAKEAIEDAVADRVLIPFVDGRDVRITTFAASITLAQDAALTKPSSTVATPTASAPTTPSDTMGSMKSAAESQRSGSSPHPPFSMNYLGPYGMGMGGWQAHAAASQAWAAMVLAAAYQQQQQQLPYGGSPFGGGLLAPWGAAIDGPGASTDVHPLDAAQQHSGQPVS